jgi:hypothetical protein
MPKLKTCEVAHKGATFKATLKVNSSGVFSIDRPGTNEDWPDQPMTISGNIAGDVDRLWVEAVRDLVERTKVERKVIVVRFDSTLRPNGRKDFHTGNDAMLFLKCAVALEVTTRQGDKSNIAYREHPDFVGFAGKHQPFPVNFRLGIHDIDFHYSACTVVEWSQEIEDMMVRACEGIEAIAEMLDGVTATPETLRLSTAQMALLPATFGNLNPARSNICPDEKHE